MARQRIRVEGRDARLVAGVALVAGVLAAFAGPSPTGSSFVDAVLLVAFGGGAVWAAASAPWWTGVAAAGVAAAFAPEWWLLVIAAVAGLGGLWIGMQRRSLPWSRALVAGVALQVLCRLGDVERFGFTAIVGIGVMLVMAVLGIRRRPRRERKVLWMVLAGVVGGAVVATLGFGLAAFQARNDLRDGNQAARRALDAFGAGDFNEAQAGFAEAAELFSSAEGSLSKPWGQLARFVPVVAQHRNSAVALTDGGASVSQRVNEVLSVVDYESLKLVGGRIDLDAIASLDQPIQDLDVAITDLEGAILDARDPWLVDAFSSRLDDLLDEVAEQQNRAENARVAISQAPAMLGADGPRVYFLAFTTPVEARGLGGYMGNWAEITIDRGQLEVTDFGRTLDLAFGGSETKRLDSISQEYVDQYGEFLLRNNNDRVVGLEAWSNITISPDFPSVAATMAELYPQSGGQEVDGVFVMDVYAIAKLMEITGPVDIPAFGESPASTIDASNAAQFLLADQYRLEEVPAADRVDMLEVVARTTTDRLLSSSLPAPPELGRMFGSLAREGRLAGWAVRPEEQEVFDRVNMAHRLPARDGGDALTVSFINEAGSKIDYFLSGDVTYDVVVDRELDVVSGTINLTVKNNAPSSGLPDYVIGSNETVQLPLGTSRTLVSIFTGLPVMGYAIDGEPAAFDFGTEGEYFVSSTSIDLASGQEMQLTVYVEGTIPDDVAYRLTLTNSPITTPLGVTVNVNGSPLTAEPFARAGTVRLP